MATLSDLTIGVTFTRCDKCEYKNNDSYRDDLLVTAGAKAAYMNYVGYIDIPKGVEGELDVSRFIVTVVDAYLKLDEHVRFSEFVESALREKYRKEG